MNDTNEPLPSPGRATKARDGAVEDLLRNVVVTAEIAADLKERYAAAERHLGQVKLLLSQASRAVNALHSTSKYSLQLAKKLLNSRAEDSGSPARDDHARLLQAVDRQLRDIDLFGDPDADDGRQKETLPRSNSGKSVKCEIDERYPENFTKESLIEFNNVVNLPPVPENSFIAFNSANKPRRSSSLSSLKSLRKVKLFLQRAESSDDEDVSSDNEDQDSDQKVGSDGERSTGKQLDHIKEETHQD